MNQPTKRTTIYDIAEKCGVSVATVSRVLSNADYPVSAATRKLVTDAARELRYTPNLLGKSLKTRTCRDIGVVVPNLTNYCYSALVQGALHVTAARGYNLILCSSDRDPLSEQRNVEMLLQKQVAGILIASLSAKGEAARAALDYGVRVAAVEQAVEQPCDRITVDFTRGAELAVRHLLSLGHRRIGFMGAPLDRVSRVMMLNGYRTALSEAGISPDEALILLAGDRPERDREAVYEFANGRLLADRFLAMPQPPTAVIALNDMTALSAMQRFQAKGLRVPEDVSVVGFDNIPFSETSLPMLTTVDQRSEELGAQAASRLCDGIEHPEQRLVCQQIEPLLVVRKSSGVCPR